LVLYIKETFCLGSSICNVFTPISVSDLDLDPDSNGLADPDPDWECGLGSGPRQAKIVPKKRKELRNFLFEEISVGLEASPGA
jgi:hypothetical protein